MPTAFNNRAYLLKNNSFVNFVTYPSVNTEGQKVFASTQTFFETLNATARYHPEKNGFTINQGKILCSLSAFLRKHRQPCKCKGEALSSNRNIDNLNERVSAETRSFDTETSFISPACDINKNAAFNKRTYPST